MAHETPEESCETQASNFLQTNCSISSQQKIVSSLQKTESKCRESVRVGGEEFDLMVQVQRKQFASLFPVSDFRNLSIFQYRGTVLRYSSRVYQ